MNACNCSRSLLVNIVKSSLVRPRVLSPLLSRPVTLQSIKCFSLSHSRILCAQNYANESKPPSRNLKAAITHELKLEKDNKGRTIIARGPLANKLFYVKIFSITTSVMGIGMQFIILRDVDSMVATVAASVMVGFFTFVTPFLINLLARRYVTELLYQEDKDMYTAVRYNFLGYRRELSFDIKEVDAPDVPGPLTTIMVTKDGKKTPLFIVEETFDDLSHYGRLMGFDKPLNLHLNTSDITSKKSKDT